MNAVQNDTLKINHCVNRAAPVSIYRDWPASLIIPIQVTLFDMHHYSHVLPTDYNPYSANLAGHAWPITEFFKSCCSHI